MFAALALMTTLAAQAPAEAKPPDPPAPLAARLNAVSPVGLGIDVAADLPLASRLPMASGRASLQLQLALPSGVWAAAGLRSGYSYAAGKTAVVDAALGEDPAALLMLHRIPIQGIATLGVRTDAAPLFGVPLRIGVYGAGGASVVFGVAQAFGRVSEVLAVAPSATVGALAVLELGAGTFGVFGEWDAAFVDLAAAAPGVSGDLSVARVGLTGSFAFGS